MQKGRSKAQCRFTWPWQDWSSTWRSQNNEANCFNLTKFRTHIHNCERVPVVLVCNITASFFSACKRERSSLTFCRRLVSYEAAPRQAWCTVLHVTRDRLLTTVNQRLEDVLHSVDYVLHTHYTTCFGSFVQTTQRGSREQQPEVKCWHEHRSLRHVEAAGHAHGRGNFSQLHAGEAGTWGDLKLNSCNTINTWFLHFCRLSCSRLWEYKSAKQRPGTSRLPQTSGDTTKTTSLTAVFWNRSLPFCSCLASYSKTRDSPSEQFKCFVQWCPIMTTKSTPADLVQSAALAQAGRNAGTKAKNDFYSCPHDSHNYSMNCTRRVT